MPKSDFNITPTMRHEAVELNVERRIWESDRGLDYTQEQIAHFTLRFEDGEIMLVKDGDEIVYSEILDES